jgi:hypothetical protein
VGPRAGLAVQDASATAHVWLAQRPPTVSAAGLFHRRRGFAFPVATGSFSSLGPVRNRTAGCYYEGPGLMVGKPFGGAYCRHAQGETRLLLNCITNTDCETHQ